MAKPVVTFEQALSTYKSRLHGQKELSKYSRWFPLYPTPCLAGIVADLMGDGHIQPKPKLRLDYTSKSLKELERFEGVVAGIFGVRGKVRECRTNKFGKTFNYGINCKPLCRVLILVGAPAGNKIKRRFGIPSWILNDRENFREFVRELFNCEGSYSRKPGEMIGIQMSKSEALMEDSFAFFMQLKVNLYDYFGIITSSPFYEKRYNIRKDGIRTKAVVLRIKRRESIKRFLLEFGPKRFKLKASEGRNTVGTC